MKLDMQSREPSATPMASPVPAATPTAVGASVQYQGYKAKARRATREPLRARVSHLLRRVRNRVLFDFLLYPYGVWRHRQLRRSSARSQAHTYTCFYRSPIQTAALLGPVLDFLVDRGGNDRRLEILVFACSSGAEVYTLASVLMHARPDLDFHICGSDLHEEMIERAIAGRYSSDEVWHSEFVTDEFVRQTFDIVGDEYVVQPAIQSRVSFTTANLLDPALESQFRPADVIFAQSVLSHLEPAQAGIAFEGLVRCMKRRSALFIRGMDLDEKMLLTRTHQLQPLAYRCRDIHEEGRRHVGHRWWRLYYGAEPFSPLRRDRLRRFGTVFLRRPD